MSLEVWGTPATDDASSYALSAAIAVPGPAVAETPERLKRYRALSIVQRGSTTPGGGVGGGHGESGFSGGSSPAAPRSAMRLFVGVDVLEMGSEATGVFGEGAVTEAVGPSGGGGATGPMVPVDITAAASTLGGYRDQGVAQVVVAASSAAAKGKGGGGGGGDDTLPLLHLNAAADRSSEKDAKGGEETKKGGKVVAGGVLGGGSGSRLERHIIVSIHQVDTNPFLLESVQSIRFSVQPRPKPAAGGRGGAGGGGAAMDINERMNQARLLLAQKSTEGKNATGSALRGLASGNAQARVTILQACSTEVDPVTRSMQSTLVWPVEADEVRRGSVVVVSRA